MADNIDGCDDKDTHCLKSKAVSYLNDAGFILGAPRGNIAFLVKISVDKCREHSEIEVTCCLKKKFSRDPIKLHFFNAVKVST
jgi:hypothetical protein